MYVHMHGNRALDRYVCVHVCMEIGLGTGMYVYTYVCMYGNKALDRYVCVHVCMEIGLGTR